MNHKTIATFFTTFVFMTVAAPALAQTQFEQLKERLLTGKPTVSIVELSQCTPQSGSRSTGGSTIGGFSIDAFQVVPGPVVRISYANEHLTVMEDGTAVLEFLQYRVFSNDTATFKVSRLSPTTYKPLSDPMTFSCPLGTGLRFEPGQTTS